jgi:hypothetical protein
VVGEIGGLAPETGDVERQSAPLEPDPGVEEVGTGSVHREKSKLAHVVAPWR